MSTDETCQIVMHGALLENFKAWLASRELHLFRIPLEGEDDLPTYGIGINQSLWERVQ